MQTTKKYGEALQSSVCCMTANFTFLLSMPRPLFSPANHPWLTRLALLAMLWHAFAPFVHASTDLSKRLGNICSVDNLKGSKDTPQTVKLLKPCPWCLSATQAFAPPPSYLPHRFDANLQHIRSLPPRAWHAPISQLLAFSPRGPPPALH